MCRVNVRCFRGQISVEWPQPKIMSDPAQSATVLAGVPAVNMTLFHRIQFSVGDSAFFAELSASSVPTASHGSRRR